MYKKNEKSAFCYVIFFMLLALSVGYLPSQIGFNFLCMAVLICPIRQVRRAVDDALHIISGRTTWYIILLIFMGYYPMNQFLMLGERMRFILNLIERNIK